MYAPVDKSAEKYHKSVSNSVGQKKSDGKKGFELMDNRSEVTQLREAGRCP